MIETQFVLTNISRKLFHFWNSKRDHIIITSTRIGNDGCGVGILKFAMCLWILLFLNNASIVNFCGWEFTELAIICGILTLSSFKKGVFFRNGYFYPMTSISIVMKQAFFIFKLFFRTKVSQNAFNFNQIESYVYSIF